MPHCGTPQDRQSRRGSDRPPCARNSLQVSPSVLAYQLLGEKRRVIHDVVCSETCRFLKGSVHVADIQFWLLGGIIARPP
jgi:hypothetical protein